MKKMLPRHRYPHRIADTTLIRLHLPKRLAQRLRRVVQESDQSQNDFISHAIADVVAVHELRTALIELRKIAEAEVIATNKERRGLKRHQPRRKP